MVQQVQNPWKILKSEDIYESPWIAVKKHDVINPGGEPGTYSVVSFKNWAIGIVPLDKDLNTWIVGQYRFPLDVYSWEIPEGGGSKNSTTLESAQRELSEECGISAKKWDLIQEFHTSNSGTDEHAFIYVARDLEFHEAHPDTDEDLKVRKIPFNELFEMVVKGEIMDSLTVVAVFKVKYLLDNNLL